MVQRDATRDGDVLVGRDREMASLAVAMEEAVSGRGSVYLLEGEPGIGKTRLADAFARRAESMGARVLWGRCWEAGGAPAYWPWIQALRGLGHDLPTRIFSELHADRAVTADPDAARFRLFDSVATALIGTAAGQPLAVVLDDLHAADEPSLLLFRFVAGAIGTAPVVLVATFRSPDALRREAAGDLMSELARTPFAHRMHLPGLTEEAIRRLVEATTGVPADADLVRALHEDTGRQRAVCERGGQAAGCRAGDEGPGWRVAPVPGRCPRSDLPADRAAVPVVRPRSRARVGLRPILPDRRSRSGRGRPPPRPLARPGRGGEGGTHRRNPRSR